MTKEAIREHQMARTGGTQTDLFTCSKCRKKNCTYTQVGVHSIFLDWDFRAHQSSPWIPPLSLLLLVSGSMLGLSGLALPSLERQECSLLFGSGCETFRPCYGGGGLNILGTWEEGSVIKMAYGSCHHLSQGMRGRAAQSPLPVRTKPCDRFSLPSPR